MVRKHIGWIALDIDGTITDKTHHAPEEVVQFLCSLEKRGWEIVFITGRTFSFCFSVVKEFPFPFYLAIQNGADILMMPQKELISRHYFDRAVISVLNEVCSGEREDFIIYAGYERGDFCYYRPDRFSPAMREHLNKVMALSPEPWQKVQEFTFGKEDRFPLAKCFGTKEAMERINTLLKNVPEVAVTMIGDPLGKEVYLNLVTAKEATKGNALRVIKQVMGEGGPTIAAGDDLNDISMLEVADIKIVMDSAPAEMLHLATIVASVKPGGIIEALTRATQ